MSGRFQQDASLLKEAEEMRKTSVLKRKRGTAALEVLTATGVDTADLVGDGDDEERGGERIGRRQVDLLSTTGGGVYARQKQQQVDVIEGVEGEEDVVDPSAHMFTDSVALPGTSAAQYALDMKKMPLIDDDSGNQQRVKKRKRTKQHDDSDSEDDDDDNDDDDHVDGGHRQQQIKMSDIERTAAGDKGGGADDANDDDDVDDDDMFAAGGGAGKETSDLTYVVGGTTVGFEPFNLRSEMQTGYFDKDGMYIESLAKAEGDKEDDDPWLSQVDESTRKQGHTAAAAMAAAAAAAASAAAAVAPSTDAIIPTADDSTALQKRQRLEAVRRRQQEQANRPQRTVADAAAFVCTVLQSDETVSKAMRRLRPPAAGSKKGKKREAPASSSSSSSSAPVPAVSEEQRKQFDDLVECADQLMEEGFTNVYSVDAAAVKAWVSEQQQTGRVYFYRLPSTSKFFGPFDRATFKSWYDGSFFASAEPGTLFASVDKDDADNPRRADWCANDEFNWKELSE